MLKYVIQRVVLMLVTLFIITGMCFILIRMLPPATVSPEDPHAEIVELRREALATINPCLYSSAFSSRVYSQSGTGVFRTSCTWAETYSRCCIKRCLLQCLLTCIQF